MAGKINGNPFVQNRASSHVAHQGDIVDTSFFLHTCPLIRLHIALGKYVAIMPSEISWRDAWSAHLYQMLSQFWCLAKSCTAGAET